MTTVTAIKVKQSCALPWVSLLGNGHCACISLPLSVKENSFLDERVGVNEVGCALFCQCRLEETSQSKQAIHQWYATQEMQKLSQAFDSFSKFPRFQSD